MPPRTLQVEGHRGFPSKAHENTLESFRIAVDEGLPGIEFDIWLTSDNVIVITHGCNNQGLEKLWDAKQQDYVYINIPHITYNELTELYIADKKTRVCTLNELIDLIELQNEMYLNIEIKHNSDQIIEETFKLIQRREVKVRI